MAYSITCPSVLHWEEDTDVQRLDVDVAVVIDVIEVVVVDVVGGCVVVVVVLDVDGSVVVELVVV